MQDKRSPDQKITRKRGGKVIFQFTATSEPVDLVEKMRQQLAKVSAFYE